MNFDERCAAVAKLGFTERQARFLTTVMLHSGVCVPRQYARYCRIVHGHKTRKFFAKLVRLGYASTYDCRHNRAQLYHLNKRSLYAAIGQASSRLQRPLPLSQAIHRLMIMDARPAVVLRHGEFWRTVWHFLVTNRRVFDMEQVAPLIDFLHAVRHEHIAVDTTDGIVMRPPPLPEFSLKGRTVQSVMRLMEEWHRGLGTGEGGYSWDASKVRPLVLEVPSGDPTEPPTFWELAELTSSAQLRTEVPRCSIAWRATGTAAGRDRLGSGRFAEDEA